MPNLLITGAGGGIGRHLYHHLSMQHNVMPLSRRPATDSVFVPCDLVTEMPRLPDSVDPATANTVDWIIHLATTYRVAEDLAMLDNLIKFAQEHGIENSLYVSSWVIHFPRRPLGASYIEMKRRCEQRLLESAIVNPQIVRPSIVMGPDLSWTKTLKRLAPLSRLIPPRFSRSFVPIDEVCRCIDKIIAGRTHSVAVTCLGTRASLAEKAREHCTGKTPRRTWSVAGVVALVIVAILTIFVPKARIPIITSLSVCVCSCCWFCGTHCQQFSVPCPTTLPVSSNDGLIPKANST